MIIQEQYTNTNKGLGNELLFNLVDSSISSRWYHRKNHFIYMIKKTFKVAKKNI